MAHSHELNKRGWTLLPRRNRLANVHGYIKSRMSHSPIIFCLFSWSQGRLAMPKTATRRSQEMNTTIKSKLPSGWKIVSIDGNTPSLPKSFRQHLKRRYDHDASDSSEKTPLVIAFYFSAGCECLIFVLSSTQRKHQKRTIHRTLVWGRTRKRKAIDEFLISVHG